MGERAVNREASTIRSTPNPPPNHPNPRGVGDGGRGAATHNRINNTQDGTALPIVVSVVTATGKRPAPIPNPEAKPDSADGTAPARVRESRTPPSTHLRYRVGLYK